MTLFVDIETYSGTSIDSGVYRYVEDPGHLILMAGWAHDEGPVQLAVGLEEIMAIPGLMSATRERSLVAHNAMFERVNLSAKCDPRLVDPALWSDTMALAAEHGFPRSLWQLAKALGVSQKDEAGKALIRKFCTPDKTGRRVLPEEAPEDWEAFGQYCVQDVVALREVWLELELLGGWPPGEHELWCTDQRVNDRGIAVDVELAEAAVLAIEANQKDQKQRMREITGLENPGSIQQLTRWLTEEHGVPVPNLRSETVQSLLASECHPDVREALELRQELALVAGKKFGAALSQVNQDNKLRGQFRFFGASTGRWSGGGVQMHNLARLGFAEEHETESAILDLKMGLGASAETIKKLVRSMFVGPFAVVDFSAIEARVLAWLADEQWVLDAFSEGRDIYVENAKRMGSKFDRYAGKVATLALGYQGGEKALLAMDHKHVFAGPSQRQAIVDSWRKANSNIVQFWWELDQTFRRGGTLRKLTVEVDGQDRRMVLPSGRALVYHGVRSRMDNSGRSSLIFSDPRYGSQSSLYGGLLVENATQAVARDVLGNALRRLESYGYNVAAHVHDEVLVPIPISDPEVAVNPIRTIMTDTPVWAKGLPLDAAGYSCARYRKD